MRIERGAIYKIGKKTFGVTEVDADQTRVMLIELEPHHADDRITITMAGKHLLELLDRQKVPE